MSNYQLTCNQACFSLEKLDFAFSLFFFFSLRTWKKYRVWQKFVLVVLYHALQQVKMQGQWGLFNSFKSCLTGKINKVLPE